MSTFEEMWRNSAKYEEMEVMDRLRMDMRQGGLCITSRGLLRPWINKAKGPGEFRFAVKTIMRAEGHPEFRLTFEGVALGMEDEHASWMMWRQRAIGIIEGYEACKL